jgi:hypothetical protein
MTVTNVRAWLQRKPQPVRLVTEDGTEIAVGSGRSKWSVAEANIAELAPAEVRALDAGGRLLRMLSFASDGQPDGDGFKITNQHDRDIKIAEIIAKVSDQSALRHEAAYKAAFEKMAFLVELLVRRLTAAESQTVRLQNMLERQAAELATQTGEDQDNVMEKMIQTMMVQQFMQPPKAVAAKPNGKGNGKKESDDGA